MSAFNHNTDSYNAPVNYLISNFIREYDISKANINILLYKGIITKRQYDYYYGLPKKVREIQIGCLMKRNATVKEALKSGFKEMRQLLFDANDVQDYEVLSIKKDAVYIIGRQLTTTKFANLEFLPKNTYTSFYRLVNLELYYYLDIKQRECLDIKGISDNMICLHEPYMLDFLKYIFATAQSGDILEAITSLQNFTKDFVDGNLDIGYYRELNNTSLFRSNVVIGSNRIYFNTLAEDVKVSDLDGTFNVELLHQLYRILFDVFLQRR